MFEKAPSFALPGALVLASGIHLVLQGSSREALNPKSFVLTAMAGESSAANTRPTFLITSRPGLLEPRANSENFPRPPTCFEVADFSPFPDAHYVMYPIFYQFFIITPPKGFADSGCSWEFYGRFHVFFVFQTRRCFQEC